MTPVTMFGAVILGVVIGGVSGLIGVGGGAFLIPAFIYFYGMSQLKAQGTSLATLLLPIGIFAFWTYYKAGHVDFKLAILISVGFALGGWLGGMWAQQLSDHLLRKGFAVLLVLLAAKVAFTR